MSKRTGIVQQKWTKNFLQTIAKTKSWLCFLPQVVWLSVLCMEVVNRVNVGKNYEVKSESKSKILQRSTLVFSKMSIPCSCSKAREKENSQGRLSTSRKYLHPNCSIFFWEKDGSVCSHDNNNERRHQQVRFVSVKAERPEPSITLSCQAGGR